MSENPLSHSRYMGSGKAQIPLRLSDDIITAATLVLDRFDANTGYQAGQRYRAANRWAQAVKSNQYIWLGVSGAATPAGLGGLFADMISRGLVDVVVTTGANVYHDLHFACGLPVRHGSQFVDDDDLRKDETTGSGTSYF